VSLSAQSFEPIANLIRSVGVEVTLTRVDRTLSSNTMGAYVTVKANPQTTGATVQQKTRLYIMAGSFVPQVGDFVDLSGRGYRIKATDSISLQGNQLVYILDLT
jgi:hypothetical protein